MNFREQVEHYRKTEPKVGPLGEAYQLGFAGKSGAAKGVPNSPQRAAWIAGRMNWAAGEEEVGFEARKKTVFTVSLVCRKNIGEWDDIEEEFFGSSLRYEKLLGAFANQDEADAFSMEQEDQKNTVVGVWTDGVNHCNYTANSKSKPRFD